MDNTVAPVSAPYATIPPTGYTGSAASPGAYEQLLNLEAYNLAATVAAGGSTGSGLGSADLLNLSPQALALLNGIGSGSGAAGVQADAGLYGVPATADASLTAIIAAYSVPGSGSGAAGVDAAIASPQQIAAIIAPYAGAPLTPGTIAQINAALASAGINPQQLSLQEMFYAFAAFIPAQDYSLASANYALSDELLDA